MESKVKLERESLQALRQFSGEHIPTGCHDCACRAAHKPAYFCKKMPPKDNNITIAVNNKTWHPDCPYREAWSMYHKLKQL